MGMSAKVEIVTPKKAEEWLGKQVQNRHLRNQQVYRHAETMRQGQWHLTGESIKFADDGTLMDGQHRLHALIEAGVDIPMLVVRGVDGHAINTLDTGLKRTLADVLKMKGEVQVTRLAAALTHIQLVRTAIELERWPYKNVNREYGGYYPTNDESLVLLANEPQIRDAVAATTRFEVQYSGLHVKPVVWAVSWYTLEAVDAEDADEFFRILVKGVNVAEGSAIEAFRRRFYNLMTHPTSTRDQFAYMFKTWNFWRTDTEVSHLRWNPGGKYGENFPRPA